MVRTLTIFSVVALNVRLQCSVLIALGFVSKFTVTSFLNKLARAMIDYTSLSSKNLLSKIAP